MQRLDFGFQQELRNCPTREKQSSLLRKAGSLRSGGYASWFRAPGETKEIKGGNLVLGSGRTWEIVSRIRLVLALYQSS